MSVKYHRYKKWGSMVIEVPKEMEYLTKNGKVKEAPPVTKTGAIATRNREKAIKLNPVKEEDPRIIKFFNIENMTLLENENIIKTLNEKELSEYNVELHNLIKKKLGDDPSYMSGVERVDKKNKILNNKAIETLPIGELNKIAFEKVAYTLSSDAGREMDIYSKSGSGFHISRTKKTKEEKLKKKQEEEERKEKLFHIVQKKEIRRKTKKYKKLENIINFDNLL